MKDTFWVGFRKFFSPSCVLTCRNSCFHVVLNDLIVLVLILQWGFFVEISVMFWFCHICVAKMVV